MNRPKKRSLRPREHGAYGQLGLPLVAALAMVRPGVASTCLAMTAIALFLVHEPILVVAGFRGAWAKQEHGSRAVRVGLGWSIVALATGSPGLYLGGDAVLRAALLPLALVLLLLAFVLRGAEKSLAGEIIAALALASAAFPVAVAGGLPFHRALAAWAAWAVGFTATTAAVHWVIAAHKGRRHNHSLMIAGVATVGAAVLGIQSWIGASSLPLLLACWGLIARPPHARHLNRVGWSLMVSGTLAVVLVVTLIRTGD